MSPEDLYDQLRALPSLVAVRELVDYIVGLESRIAELEALAKSDAPAEVIS